MFDRSNPSGNPSPDSNLNKPHEIPPVAGPTAFRPGPSVPPRKTNTCLVVGLVLGAVFGVGSICLCGGILYFAIPREATVTPQDHAVVVDAEAVQDFVAFDPSRGEETIKKSKYFDGSYELEYEFEDDSDDGLLITFSLAVERTPDDAKSGYFVTWEAIKLGTKLHAAGVDVQFEEHNQVFRWGDQSRFVILKSEGVPFGNVFIAQKGNKIVTFVLANAYFEDESIEQLLGPKLAQIDAYSPDD